MKTDALARRLRYAPPNPVVRRMVLTEPDYLIFETINRHGPLPSHYLYAYTKHLRKDESHLKNRLTEMYNGDAQGPYLTRPQQQFAGFEARYQHIVYDLAPRAKVALAERGTIGRFSPRRIDPFLHQLMGACVAASIELSAGEKGIQYIGREQILAHHRCGQAKDAPNPMAIPLPGLASKALVPDDLFALKYPEGGFRFFAVEIDRNTESIERRDPSQNAFGGKVKGYLEILRRRLFDRWWGIPNMSVLTVTTNATHGRNILDYIERLGDETYQDRFAVAIETSFVSNWRVPKGLLSHLMTDPWHTATGTKDIGAP